MKLIQKWEDIDSVALKAASTAYAPGDALKYSAGKVIPATAGDAVCGVCCEEVLSSDSDYATVRNIARQLVHSQYRFQATVTIGTALASMEGSTFDIDTANPGSIDVSGSGTQFTIDKVLSTTLVEGYFVDIA